MKKGLMILFLILVVNSCGDTKKETLKKVFSTYKGGHALVVIKKEFRLEVYNSNNELVNSYKIGFGSNPDMKPKLYEGDNRTPEGIYQINEILSMDAGKDSASYRKLQSMNTVFFKKVNGYHRYAHPEYDLGDNAYGPRYYGINYPNETDNKNYREAVEKGEIPSVHGKTASIGNGIAIHGNNDEDSIGHLCSSGCIRMFNSDVVDLEKYLILSSPVIIINQ